jgi:hypothetical protein
MNAKKLKKLAAQIPQSDADLSALLTATITAQTKRESAVARRDAKIAAAKAAIEIEHGFDAIIAAQDAILERNLELLETWTTINAKRLGDAKSLVVGGHRFGWRLGNWKTVATDTWDKVTAKLREWREAGKADDASPEAQERAAMAAEYLVDKCEPDRKAMLRDRDRKPARALLAKAGVEFEQDESFYLEPDREGQQAPRLEAA